MNDDNPRTILARLMEEYPRLNHTERYERIVAAYSKLCQRKVETNE